MRRTAMRGLLPTKTCGQLVNIEKVFHPSFAMLQFGPFEVVVPRQNLTCAVQAAPCQSYLVKAADAGK